MKNRKTRANRLLLLMTAVLLSLPSFAAFAANSVPMTPELAAKNEMVRKQEKQRITPEKRKIAAEALKAERIKVYTAKKAVQHSNPATTDNK